ENPETTGFYRLKNALGSKVRYVTGSAYTLSPKELGTFDIVLFFGVLYHLRYPLLAIDRLRSVSCGDVYVETHIIKEISKGKPVWQQYREFELNSEDQSNWFGPNEMAVLESFRSAGFELACT